MKRSASNFLSVVLSDILRRCIGFFAVAYLARKLGTSGFGMVNIALMALTYALVISSAGLHSLGTREVARGDPSRIAPNIIGLRLTLSVITYLAIAGVTFLFVQSDVLRSLIAIFTLSVFPLSFFLDWYFQGKEEMGKMSFAKLVSGGVYFCGLLIFVHSIASILWVGVAIVVGDFVSTSILIALFWRRYGPLRIAFDIKRWGSIMKQAIPMGGGSILATLCVNLPVLALGVMASEYSVGIFSAAAKLVMFLLFLDRGFGMLLLPASSRLHALSQIDLRNYLSRALKWILVIALPLTVGGTILAPKIIALIFGAQFAESGPVLRVAIWFFLFTMIHTVYTTGLIASGREAMYGKIMLISTVIYVVCVVGGIYFLGVIGAAYGASAGEAITLLISAATLNKYVRVQAPDKTFHILLALVAMGIVVYSLYSGHVVVSIAAGATVYAACLLLLRAVSVQEIAGLVRHQEAAL
jgi:O-antigen/teichoic acid export membrane protein